MNARTNGIMLLHTWTQRCISTEHHSMMRSAQHTNLVTLCHCCMHWIGGWWLPHNRKPLSCPNSHPQVTSITNANTPFNTPLTICTQN
jgi:hypothetical protein